METVNKYSWGILMMMMMMIMLKMIIKSSYILSLIKHLLFVGHCNIAIWKMDVGPVLIEYII